MTKLAVAAAPPDEDDGGAVGCLRRHYRVVQPARCLQHREPPQPRHQPRQRHAARTGIAQVEPQLAVLSAAPGVHGAAASGDGHDVMGSARDGCHGDVTLLHFVIVPREEAHQPWRRLVRRCPRYRPRRRRPMSQLTEGIAAPRVHGAGIGENEDEVGACGDLAWLGAVVEGLQKCGRVSAQQVAVAQLAVVSPAPRVDVPCGGENTRVVLPSAKELDLEPAHDAHPLRRGEECAAPPAVLRRRAEAELAVEIAAPRKDVTGSGKRDHVGVSCCHSGHVPRGEPEHSGDRGRGANIARIAVAQLAVAIQPPREELAILSQCSGELGSAADVTHNIVS